MFTYVRIKCVKNEYDRRNEGYQTKKLPTVWRIKEVTNRGGLLRIDPGA